MIEQFICVCGLLQNVLLRNYSIEFTTKDMTHIEGIPNRYIVYRYSLTFLLAAEMIPYMAVLFHVTHIMGELSFSLTSHYPATNEVMGINVLYIS